MSIPKVHIHTLATLVLEGGDANGQGLVVTSDLPVRCGFREVNDSSVDVMTGQAITHRNTAIDRAKLEDWVI